MHTQSNTHTHTPHSHLTPSTSSPIYLSVLRLSGVWPASVHINTALPGRRPFNTSCHSSLIAATDFRPAIGQTCITTSYTSGPQLHTGHTVVTTQQVLYRPRITQALIKLPTNRVLKFCAISSLLWACLLPPWKQKQGYVTGRNLVWGTHLLFDNSQMTKVFMFLNIISLYQLFDYIPQYNTGPYGIIIYMLICLPSLNNVSVAAHVKEALL